EAPRIAGISSFGAGGSNAHLIVEEYIEPASPEFTVTADQPAVVVLSARDEERLKEQVAQLLQAIDGQGFKQADLADIAYTLQVGREALGVRLACVVGSLEELRAKLERQAQGEPSIE